MVDDRNPRDRETYVTRESHVERDTGRSGSAMAFVVGGLVVAVLVIAYFFFGTGNSGMGDADIADGGTETNVTVETPDGGEDGGDGSVTDGGTETNVTVGVPDEGEVVEDGGNSGQENGGIAQEGGNAIDNGGDGAADATTEEAN